MRKTLRLDTQTDTLRVVYVDRWDGVHERTEYRVTDGRGGRPIRGHLWADLDGRPVEGSAPSLYIRTQHGGALVVWCEETPALQESTACPRWRGHGRDDDGRRKCERCTEAAA